MSSNLKYKRILLKLSGQALVGDKHFGIDPAVSYWEMTHGDGGGVECIEMWAHPNIIDRAWKEAGFLTRYNPASNDRR